MVRAAKLAKNALGNKIGECDPLGDIVQYYRSGIFENYFGEPPGTNLETLDEMPLGDVDLMQRWRTPFWAETLPIVDG